MPRFLVSISDEDAELLREWNKQSGFGWTVKQCLESAIERGISSIALEVADNIAYEEQQDTKEED